MLVIALALGVAACGGEEPSVPQVAATPTADPELVGEVSATFATYRSGVVQGDAGAVLGALDEGSVEAMARVAELAETADEATVRDLPAADQLLVLTYRLRPELLEGDDPYENLVEAGLAGQDRSLGDLGDISPVRDDVAFGVVTDPATSAPTPQRWRFEREGDVWRFDLVEAHRLLSDAIDAAADRAGVGVDDLVAATVVDLSGEDPRTVQELYTETP